MTSLDRLTGRRLEYVIMSSHEGVSVQVVFSGRCTTGHKWHGCALLGCGGGVKGHSPRERVAQGEPLRPDTYESHTQNAVRRRPWFTLPIWSQSPVVRRRTSADSPSVSHCVSVRARS